MKTIISILTCLILFTIQARSQIDPAANFANAAVSTGYDAAATSITLSTGKGALFPVPADSGAYNVVWWNATDYSNPSNDPNVEVVRVTARSGDVLTVTRAQEGTSATTKNTGGKTYRMSLGMTAKTIIDLRTLFNSMPTWDGVSGYLLIDSSGTVVPFRVTSGKLLGRYSSGNWTIQEITISTGLNLDASGNLTSTATGGADGQDADSAGGKRISFYGRDAATGRLTVFVFEKDSNEYVHRPIAKFVTTGTLGSTGYVYFDTDSTLKIGVLPAGVSDGDKGDITVSSSGTVFTIDAGVVSLAKMADMATASLIYRKTAGTGAPEVNTLATLKTDLTLVKGDVGLSNVDNTSNATERAATATLTNKRITPRVTSIASNATWSPSADNDDVYEVTAQAVAVTTISNPSGTPVDCQQLIFRVKDNGTARSMAAAFGSQYRASSDLALPTTTTISKTMYMKFLFNSADTKWDLVALLDNF